MIGLQNKLALALVSIESTTRVIMPYIKGDAMNLTVTFQNNMLGVGLGFSYNHALFWCQWLSIDENYFLRWSLNMTSTCLEHKTRITSEFRIEKKSHFGMLLSNSSHHPLVNEIRYTFFE